MKKYRVLTGTWKYNLSADDIIPASLYSETILSRACEAGYIEEYPKEPPTMASLKDEIIDYLEAEDIEHDPSDTKSELLDLIDDVD